jgi:hypothetical protein
MSAQKCERGRPWFLRSVWGSGKGPDDRESLNHLKRKKWINLFPTSVQGTQQEIHETTSSKVCDSEPSGPSNSAKITRE